MVGYVFRFVTPSNDAVAAAALGDPITAAVGPRARSWPPPGPLPDDIDVDADARDAFDLGRDCERPAICEIRGGRSATSAAAAGTANHRAGRTLLAHMGTIRWHIRRCSPGLVPTVLALIIRVPF
jgi:hypothetical protein